MKIFKTWNVYFVFWFAQLLRWHLAQCFSLSLINCYVDISRTIYFLVCLTVTLESRALAHYLFSSFFNYNVNVLRTNCFSALFNYYVGMLRTICFLLSSPIALVCCELFVFSFLKLLRWYVAHFLFYTFFNYHVGMLRTISSTFSDYYVCVLRTISFLLLTATLVCCALFVFYFL